MTVVSLEMSDEPYISCALVLHNSKINVFLYKIEFLDLKLCQPTRMQLSDIKL